MSNIEMKQYAEDYLELHNSQVLELWEKLEIEFFNDMLAGQHGDINIIGDTWCEIEIRGADSRSGNPILFTFPKSMAGAID